jgi:Rrf2 family protein
VRNNAAVYISARADYATRALLVLAAAGGGPVKGEDLARAQGLPHKFLENTLTTLRHAGVLETQRGADGGYRLARPAAEITIADIMRPLDGPLAEVRGEKPEEAVYEGAAANLRDVWVAVRAALRDVLETVTLADIVDGKMPPVVQELLTRPGAWERRSGRVTAPPTARPAPAKAAGGTRQPPARPRQPRA